VIQKNTSRDEGAQALRDKWNGWIIGTFWALLSSGIIGGIMTTWRWFWPPKS